MLCSVAKHLVSIAFSVSVSVLPLVAKTKICYANGDFLASKSFISLHYLVIYLIIVSIDSNLSIASLVKSKIARATKYKVLEPSSKKKSNENEDGR